MKYQLINIGRGHFNGIVEADSDYVLLKEIKKHLVSKYVHLDWWSNVDARVFAGYHTVGEVKLLRGENENG